MVVYLYNEDWNICSKWQHSEIWNYSVIIKIKPQIWRMYICLSQLEDTNPWLLFVKTYLMRVCERASHEDWPSIPVYGYFITDNVQGWLWKTIVWHSLSWDVYARIMFQRAPPSVYHEQRHHAILPLFKCVFYMTSLTLHT